MKYEIITALPSHEMALLYALTVYFPDWTSSYFAPENGRFIHDQFTFSYKGLHRLITQGRVKIAMDNNSNISGTMFLLQEQNLRFSEKDMVLRELLLWICNKSDKFYYLSCIQPELEGKTKIIKSFVEYAVQKAEQNRVHTLFVLSSTEKAVMSVWKKEDFKTVCFCEDTGAQFYLFRKQLKATTG